MLSALSAVLHFKFPDKCTKIRRLAAIICKIKWLRCWEMTHMTRLLVGSIDINYLREHRSHRYLYEHRCGNSLSVVITVTRSFEVTSQPRFYDLSVNRGFTSQFLVAGFPEALNRISNCRSKMQEKRKSFWHGLKSRPVRKTRTSF